MNTREALFRLIESSSVSQRASRGLNRDNYTRDQRFLSVEFFVDFHKNKVLIPLSSKRSKHFSISYVFGLKCKTNN